MWYLFLSGAEQLLIESASTECTKRLCVIGRFSGKEAVGLVGWAGF